MSRKKSSLEDNLFDTEEVQKTKTKRAKTKKAKTKSSLEDNLFDTEEEEEEEEEVQKTKAKTKRAKPTKTRVKTSKSRKIRTGEVEPYFTNTVDHPYDPDATAEKFLRDGYIVMPSAYKSPDRYHDRVNLHKARPAEMTSLRHDLEYEFLHMPEFKNNPKFSECNKEVGYGCGACSFLGNPSSYHNTISRRLRAYTTLYLIPFFKSVLRLLQERGPVPESLMVMARPSRIMVRGDGRVPGKEGWHRDVNATSRDGEIYIGGWENADNVDEKFIGLKGTHSLAAVSAQKAKGFTKIPKEQHPQYNKMLRDQANQADTDKDGKIVVPPRHFILFFQNMAHSVHGTKGPTAVKHFLGYRITPYNTTGMAKPDAKGAEYTFSEMETKFKMNDVMPMGSGKTPPVYPGRYFAYHRKHMPIYDRFKANFLRDDVMKYEDAEHLERDDRTRTMKSLAECGFDLYPEYTRPELDLMRPNKVIKIFNPDTQHLETHFLHGLTESDLEQPWVRDFQMPEIKRPRDSPESISDSDSPAPEI